MVCAQDWLQGLEDGEYFDVWSWMSGGGDQKEERVRRREERERERKEEGWGRYSLSLSSRHFADSWCEGYQEPRGRGRAQYH